MMNKLMGATISTSVYTLEVILEIILKVYMTYMEHNHRPAIK